MSYRHSKLESHFVLGLVDAFRERAAHDHLLDIVTNVKQRMSRMEGRMPPLEDRSEIKDFKQTSEVKYTLRKKVRFRYWSLVTLCCVSALFVHAQLKIQT